MLNAIRSLLDGRGLAPTPVARAVPQLASQRRRAYRLHPYLANSWIDPTASKIGGLFHRPPGCADPTCPVHGRGLTNILQVRGDDIPGWTPGTLLQVLWCPRDHEQACPHVVVRRLTITGTGTTAGDASDPEWSGLIPTESRIEVEGVEEYPALWELDDDLQQQVARVENWKRWALHLMPGDFDAEDECDDPAGVFYDSNLAAAPGWKVGGWCQWIQAPWKPDCPNCSSPMAHLVTLSSGMCDGGSWWRWGRRSGDPGWNRAGIMLGDCGNIYVFECPACQHIDWNFQCS